MPKLVPSVLFVGVAAAAAGAQGVLPLDQQMRFGSLATSFWGPCGWSSLPTTSGDAGTVVLRPDGTCTVQVDRYEVCPGGAAFQGPIENTAGTYQVCTDGTLAVRWQPQQPGVDDDTVSMRADGSVIVRTRFHDRGEESVLLVGVALSSGKTALALTGPYRVVRFLQRNQASGLVLQGDVGTIVFDGRGGYVDQGTRRVLSAGGVGTTSGYGPLNGTYAVAEDGTVTTAVGALGAVADDGEVFFWMRRAGTDVSLTIGLRQGSSYDAAMAAGRWHLATMQNAIASTVSPMELRTEWGSLDLLPTSASGGTLGSDTVRVVTTPTQTMAMPQVAGDAFAISAQGDLGLFTGSPAPMPGALAADGSVFAALTVPGDGIGVTVGIAAAAWPTPFGRPTPGSGGVAPLVLTVGGFPYVGNGEFGVVVAGGRGGALAGLVLAGGATNGLPLFGGLVHVDPTQGLASFGLVLSSPVGLAGVGAAAVPLPLPLVPSAAGFGVVGQAFVLDPGAPGGVAMSRGLRFAVGR